MTKKNNRSKYEPPVARDLSGPFVKGDGDVPTGTCWSGSALASVTCQPGTTPSVATCSPVGAGVGGEGVCSPCGYGPDQGYCSPGGLATEGCIPSGAIHA